MGVGSLKKLSNPKPYPAGASYGTLLHWHLCEWGTHPKCTKDDNSDLPDPAMFANGLHPPSKRDRGDPSKNLRNWMTPLGAPPRDDYQARKIQEKLFFDDDKGDWNPAIEDWANELWDARRKRYPKRDIPDYKDGLKSSEPPRSCIASGMPEARHHAVSHDAKAERNVVARHEASMLFRLGVIGVDLNARETAMNKALHLYRSLNDPDAEAKCLIELGHIAYAKMNFSGAKSLYESVLTILGDAGLRHEKANAIFGLANIALRDQDIVRAEELYETAKSQFVRLNSEHGIAVSNEGLAKVAVAQNAQDTAIELLKDAELRFHCLGIGIGEANCIYELARIYRNTDKYADAKVMLERAQALYQNSRDTLGQANCAKQLGEISNYLAEHEDERRYLLEASNLYQQYRNGVGRN